ncbi:MAG TPA: hypothetical protein VHO01_08940 [Jatrophihabitans sp.]|nr:hypothetical protein [Jatrophihabitans sp.]
MTERTRRTVPQALVWGLAAVAVVLLAAAVVIAGLRLRDRHGGAAQLTASENAAIAAARQETINIQTYRLKSFDADFQAALAGLTPAKKVQWQANEATLKANLTSQKIDSTATVSGAGLISQSGDTALVAVSSDTARVDAQGKTTVTAQNRFQVTMKLIKGKWLMDDFEAVSIS